jgi:S-adenosyl-L-methionine hydrolase (adenosine-forming)
VTRRRTRRAPLVTLASDLGPEYTAQVKAVLLRSVDPSRIVELTHDLPAHGVAEAAFLLKAMAQDFPPGTIHLAVVDPGVGGRRAAIVIRCADGSRLVGPDNGLLFPLAESLGRPRAYRIDPARLGGTPRVGTTFDARDLFAPATARLALGTLPSSLGTAVRPKVYRIPVGSRSPGGATGEVVHADRFGNLITNLPTDWVARRRSSIALRIGRRRFIVPWVASYESLGRGALGALGSSFGTIEIAVAQGRADRRLRLRPGVRIAVSWTVPRRGRSP